MPRRRTHSATAGGTADVSVTGPLCAACAADGVAADTDTQRSPRWQKVLYRRQPYPDNYVDSSFLESLAAHPASPPHDLWAMVRASAALIEQISAVSVFLLGFQAVREGVPLSAVLLADAAVTGVVVAVVHVAGARAAAAAAPHPPPPRNWRDAAASTASQIVVVVAILLTVAPIVQTLTLSYCTDTIWWLALLFAAVHVVSHDYRAPPAPAAPFSSSSSSSSSAGDASVVVVPGTLSLNAALFAAALLSSRLPSTEHVFTFLVIAIQLFAAFPLARNYVRARAGALHAWVTAALVALTVGLLLRVGSPAAAAGYASLVGVLALGCPLWFLSMQPPKTVTSGPWDLAVTQQQG